MADIQDLKSWARNKACGFKSHHRHHFYFIPGPPIAPARHGDQACREGVPKTVREAKLFPVPGVVKHRSCAGLLLGRHVSTRVTAFFADLAEPVSGAMAA